MFYLIHQTLRMNLIIIFHQYSVLTMAYYRNSPRASDDLSQVFFDALSVSSAIKSLKASSSSSFDWIQNVLLVKSVQQITAPLCILFERSLSENFVPDIWKTAMIILIHKKGPSASAANFRTISLVFSISKLMERVVVSQMASFLTTHNLIFPAQLVFKPAVQLSFS